MCPPSRGRTAHLGISGSACFLRSRIWPSSLLGTWGRPFPLWGIHTHPRFCLRCSELLEAPTFCDRAPHTLSSMFLVCHLPPGIYHIQVGLWLEPVESGMSRVLERVKGPSPCRGTTVERWGRLTRTLETPRWQETVSRGAGSQPGKTGHRDGVWGVEA